MLTGAVLVPFLALSLHIPGLGSGSPEDKAVFALFNQVGCGGVVEGMCGVARVDAMSGMCAHGVLCMYATHVCICSSVHHGHVLCIPTHAQVLTTATGLGVVWLVTRSHPLPPDMFVYNPSYVDVVLVQYLCLVDNMTLAHTRAKTRHNIHESFFCIFYMST